MNSTTRTATAVAAGYLLGRTRKMRLAITVAGLVAGRKLDLSPAELIRRGGDLVGSSPEVKRLTDQVRGRLLDAAREAAVTAAGSQINRVSDRLRDRSDGLRSLPPVGAEDEEWEEPEEEEEEEGTDSEQEQSSTAARRAAGGAQKTASSTKKVAGKKASDSTPASKAATKKAATKNSASSGSSATKKATAKKATPPGRGESTTNRSARRTASRSTGR